MYFNNNKITFRKPKKYYFRITKIRNPIIFLEAPKIFQEKSKNKNQKKYYGKPKVFRNTFFIMPKIRKKAVNEKIQQKFQTHVLDRFLLLASRVRIVLFAAI